MSRFSIPNFRVPTLASIVGDMDQSLEHGPSPEEDADAWEIESASQQVEAGERAEDRTTLTQVKHDRLLG